MVPYYCMALSFFIAALVIGLITFISTFFEHLYKKRFFDGTVLIVLYIAGYLSMILFMVSI